MAVIRADVRGTLTSVRTIADVAICILGGAALGVAQHLIASTGRLR